jgi:hypothetical protein
MFYCLLTRNGVEYPTVQTAALYVHKKPPNPKIKPQNHLYKHVFSFVLEQSNCQATPHRRQQPLQRPIDFCSVQWRNFLPTFRENLSVPSRCFKKLSDSWTQTMGPIGCPETSKRNYYSSLRNSPEECSSQTINIFLTFTLPYSIFRCVRLLLIST